PFPFPFPILLLPCLPAFSSSLCSLCLCGESSHSRPAPRDQAQRQSQRGERGELDGVASLNREHRDEAFGQNRRGGTIGEPDLGARHDPALVLIAVNVLRQSVHLVALAGKTIPARALKGIGEHERTHLPRIAPQIALVIAYRLGVRQLLEIEAIDWC